MFDLDEEVLPGVHHIKSQKLGWLGRIGSRELSGANKTQADEPLAFIARAFAVVCGVRTPANRHAVAAAEPPILALCLHSFLSLHQAGRLLASLNANAAFCVNANTHSS